MIQANIANFVRQEVRVSKRKPLLPVFEAVSNALDAIAERIHQSYLETARPGVDPNNPTPAVGKKWSELSEEQRDGNREAADHLWAKVRTLGHELEEVPQRKRQQGEEYEDEWR